MSTNFTGTNSAASKSSTGLALELFLNSTSIRPGEGISISVVELNTLPGVNNASASTRWPLKGLGIGPCGPLNLPMGAAVFQGYYTATNISSAQQLQLYKPGTYVCPMILSGIDAYVFQPMSFSAAIYASGSQSPWSTLNMSSSIGVSGYWAGNLLLGPTFGGFSPGLYTVVGGDEWGTLVVLHFLVASSGTAAGGLQVHVVQDGSGQPVAGRTVVAGSTSSKDDIALTPGGPALKECVHEVPSGSTVMGNGKVVLPNGTVNTISYCPPKTYTTNGTGWVSIPDATGQYYFFEIGTLQAMSAFGIIDLSQNGPTYLTVHVPSGNYTVVP